MQDLAKKWAYYFLFDTGMGLAEKKKISNSNGTHVSFEDLGEALLKHFDDKAITPEEVCEIFCALLPLHKDMDELEIKEMVFKRGSELKADALINQIVSSR